MRWESWEPPLAAEMSRPMRSPAAAPAARWRQRVSIQPHVMRVSPPSNRCKNSGYIPKRSFYSAEFTDVLLIVYCIRCPDHMNVTCSLSAAGRESSFAFHLILGLDTSTRNILRSLSTSSLISMVFSNRYIFKQTTSCLTHSRQSVTFCFTCLISIWTPLPILSLNRVPSSKFFYSFLLKDTGSPFFRHVSYEARYPNREETASS